MYQKFRSADRKSFKRSRNKSSHKNWSSKKSNRSFHKNFSRSKRNGFRSSHIETSFFINKDVTPQNQSIYQATFQFADFNLNKDLKQSIINKGYITPTPIQDKSIPIIIQGKDIIGLANTGTGKTAAFLIPLINHVLINRNKKILIIAPTRELASQINKELISFVRGMGIYSALITGGSNMGRQIYDLKRKYNFVIGTPGRIIDMIERKFLRLDNISTVVIDEADRMLDMGFIDDIRKILNQTQQTKQTLLFSATLAPKIESLINDFLKNPTKISVVENQTNNIYQDIVSYESHQNKKELLIGLLGGKEFKKVLVFTETKRGADELSDKLFEQKIKNVAIHGDKRQSKRRQALHNFKEEKIRVLIATDVAARGLDIDNISHVINYDIPATKEDYIHRIGRTARANKTGVALTFVKNSQGSRNDHQTNFSRRNFSNNYKRSRSRYR